MLRLRNMVILGATILGLATAAAPSEAQLFRRGWGRPYSPYYSSYYYPSYYWDGGMYYATPTYGTTYYSPSTPYTSSYRVMDGNCCCLNGSVVYSSSTANGASTDVIRRSNYETMPSPGDRNRDSNGNRTDERQRTDRPDDGARGTNGDRPPRPGVLPDRPPAPDSPK